MDSRVALIILNYNGLKNLGDILVQSIESALRIDYKDLDVIVVDNGSTDNSVEEIEDRFGSDVTLIKLEKNYGYAGGNEIGLRRYLNYKGVPKYVVIMNNDFIVKNEQFLRSIVKYLDARKDIAIAQGITLDADGKRIESAGVFQDVMLQQMKRCSGLKPSECPEKLSYATFALGALMVVKIKPVLEIRGCLFKREHFILWEETELALNMWSHGFKTIAVPEISGIHMGSATTKKVMPLAWYAGKRNRYLVYRKTLSPYLRSRYLYLLIAFEIANFYLRIFQGDRGRIASRGVVDGIMARELTRVKRGTYEPLLLAPKVWQAIHNLTLSASKNLAMKYGYLSRLVTLTVDDEKLRSSPTPFLVKV